MNIKKIKKPEVENLFGKKKDRGYKIRRDVFFIALIAFLILVLIFRRYVGFFHFINILSMVGLAIVILFFHIGNKAFDIGFKKRHYFFIVIMSVFGIALGFLLYTFPYYYLDKLQHLIFPMMYASILLYMVRKLKLTKGWTLFFIFAVVVASLSIFELMEYFLDLMFDWKLQGVFFRTSQVEGGFKLLLSRIDDTMVDILLGIIGTLIYVLSILLISPKKKRL